MALTRFEDLDVWKRSARLSVDLYKALNELTDFGFRDQISRSGLSVPSSIAEDLERRSTKDKRRHLDIALGSCAELRTQVYIVMEVGYMDKTLGKTWVSETKEISAMLIGLSNTLTDH